MKHQGKKNNSNSYPIGDKYKELSNSFVLLCGKKLSTKKAKIYWFVFIWKTQLYGEIAHYGHGEIAHMTSIVMF